MQGELPETKAALYERFIRYHYEWKQAEFPTNLTEQDELKKALGELAQEALTKSTTRFRIAHKLAYKVMGETLFNCACRLGLLNQVNRDFQTDEPFYAFYHPTFQEYFAALAIDDWGFFLPRDHKDKPVKDADDKDKPYRIFERQWKEVILLWLGREDEKLREQKEKFIQALVELADGCDNFYQYRAYFLAAAGIAEFGNCSRADEIVVQIVKWGCGYFDIKKQKGVSFIEPLAKGARAVLIETEHTKAIIGLEDLIKNSQNQDALRLAAESLGKIDSGNPTVIEALEDLIQNSEDEYIYQDAAESLGKIDKGNPTAIEAIVQLFEYSQDEDTRERATESLGEIGSGDPTAIEAIVQLLQYSQDEDTRERAAESLGKIGSGNPTAIKALEDLIQNSQHEDTRLQLAKSLGYIDKGNPTAIKALEDLIQNSQHEDIRWRAAKSLGYIDKGNPTAIKALEDLIQNSQHEDIRWRAAESLRYIDEGNPTAIKALVELLQNSQDEDIRWRAALRLRYIDEGNPTAIEALEELLQNSEDIFIYQDVAESLGKIDPGNPAVIIALVELIQNSEDEYILWRAAESLGKIDPGNPAVIIALVELIQIPEDEYIFKDETDILDIRWEAAWELKEILGKANMAGVVTALKDYLSNETNKLNDYVQYGHCYELVWHCAQALPYPDFYQVWHHPQLTPHPEVSETTGVGFTPDSQSLNLADLPERLRAALDRNPDLRGAVQLICINGSKFVDRNNPATKIYNEMRSQGCPNYSDGKPRTMAQLQDYWDELRLDDEHWIDSARALVLVFYENPTAPLQGFSETFLDALSRFDGAICALSNQPNIPLQSFSPNQPNLVVNVVGWIREIVLENP